MLLDEPTNHLDLDSKEVLLDALADYGGTLIFVSHDRYFVERLALTHRRGRRGEGDALPGHVRGIPVVEGTWRGTRGHCRHERRRGAAMAPAPTNGPRPRRPSRRQRRNRYDDQKRETADRRKRERAFKNLRDRINELEARIAERERSIKELEVTMAAPGFYAAHDTAKPVLDQHQALMWEVAELLGQWEMLQGETEGFADLKT